MKRDRNRTLLIGILIIASILVVIRIYPLLTQEENTVEVLSGIVNLNLRDTLIYEYDADTTTAYYISKSKDGNEPILLMLESDGWSFVEQFGSGFLFEATRDASDRISVGSTLFSRYYRLWQVPQEEKSEILN